MESPEKYLKCVGFSTTQDSDGTIAQYVFDDGSIWQQHVGGGWECIWKPEPVVVAWSQPSGIDNTNELNRRIGYLEAERDAWKKAANVARCREAKLETDLDTARKALDFQVDQRQKLEDQLGEFKAIASSILGINIEFPNELKFHLDFLKAQKEAGDMKAEELESEVATLKSKPAEVQKLDWGRVKATTCKRMHEISEDAGWINSSRLAAAAVVHALLCFNGGRFNSEPYDLK